MGIFVCCILFFNIFNLNFDSNFINSVFKNPINFFESLFLIKNLPIQTKNSKSLTLALVGDSMTHTLGTADPLKDALKRYYPDKNFGILNLGIGSTTILSVPDRLEKESKRGTEVLPPILLTNPDIILLESFGNNPLSNLGLEKGLGKQTQTLDQIIKIIKKKKPETVLVFVATIAPSKEEYAKGVVNLSTQERIKWAEERIAYIKNHISYAKTHNIPLINIYEKSLNDKGEANLDYINTTDFIHPSVLGIQFISQQIANQIFTDKIIPN